MATTENRIRVGILGASGYTGGELLRLLARHPHVDVGLLTAERHAGEQLGAVFPHLAGYGFPALMHLDDVEWGGVELDVLFCALPHGATHAVARGLLKSTGYNFVDEVLHESVSDLIAAHAGEVKVIDLSPDFRLTNTAVYGEWYRQSHAAPELQSEAVYGLTEFARPALRSARLIACPGCYPTTALLALVPLLEAGLISAEDIIIDAKSGVTGAGRGATEANLFAEIAEGIHAYGIAGHRHLPEIEQELARAAGGDIRVSFTPHLMPMSRGILATMYVRLAGGIDADEARACLAERFGDEPFVGVVPAGVAPATRHVRGSNHCLIGVFADRVPGRAIIVSVLDNLVKGASGQAVQNMNLACGMAETSGLEQLPLFP
jgi:N-acetyl-gamma-glutamyl-phosphate reductase